MSAIEKLEQRLSALETEVAKIKQAKPSVSTDDRPWWEKIYGTFADDAYYKEAMELGRKYSESFRPHPRKKKKK